MLLTLFEEVENFRQFDPQVTGFSEERVRSLVKNLEPLFPRQWGTRIGNVGARPVPLQNNSRALQLEVGARDRIGINQQLLSENPNGWHFLAGPEAGRGHQVFYLVHDLQVDRDAVTG